MIKRNSSKANMSLVNMAQEELLNVSGGIVTSTPVTNLKAVKYSNNFELDKDGSYILRKPLVLKETIPNKDTYYLYDKTTKATFLNGHINLENDETIYVKLKFYDRDEKEYFIDYLSTYNFITEFISVYNAIDHTLLSVKINHETFLNTVTRIYGSSTIPIAYLVNAEANYNPNLYRFVKIYKDLNLGDNVWVIEIVHPEFNSITSSMGEEGIDFNMLLDNPYAIRDLYNYGYESATKILAYLPFGGLSNTDINNLAIYQITESNLINGQGFKILTEANYDDATAGTVVLKAFVTAKQRSGSEINNYYCCWERSENGIDWEECPEFLDKISDDSYTAHNKTCKVADITSVEFENIIKSESLDTVLSYLVDKQLTRARFSSQNDIVKDRPDVLLVPMSALKYQYRFLVYFDTNKNPENKYSNKIASKNFFKTANVNNVDETTYVDSEEKYFHYYTKNYKGALGTSPNAYNYTDKSAEVQNGLIVLYPGRNSSTEHFLGNGLTIIPNVSENLVVSKLKITLADPETNVSGGTTTFKYPSAIIGYSATNKNKYGIYGGTINYAYALNAMYQEECTQDFLDHVEPMKAGYGWTGFEADGSSIIFLNEAHRGETYNGGKTLYLGYQDVEGFFFTLPDSVTGNVYCVFDQMEPGQVLVATHTGWQILDAPPFPLSYYRLRIQNNDMAESLKGITEVAASNTYVIDLEQYAGLTDVTVYCVSNLSYNYNAANDYPLRIEKIEIEYKIPLITQTTTSVYQLYAAGPYNVPYSKDTTVVEDISKQRQNIFYGKMLFDKAAYKFFAKDKVFYTDTNSFVIKALNVLDFSDTVTKVVQYRDYLVVFTDKDISLVHENADGTYGTKIISASVGLPKVDANTVSVILNSIYFKSETKVYKLVPNLYASTEDVIDIKLVSTPIDELFTHIVNRTFETSNFSYSDIDTYRIFIPNSNSLTYCFVYELERKAWTLLSYPVALSRLEVDTIGKAYVVKETSNENYTESGIYHFKEDISTLLEEIRLQDFTKIGAVAVDDNEEYPNIKVRYIDDYGLEIVRPTVYGNSTYTFIDSDAVYAKIPYGDYLLKTPLMLYSAVNAEALNLINGNDIDFDDFKIAPMAFNIDFGQKSSNYTIDKQFLETKFIFATLHPKDLFPVTVDISTDGIQKPLHWDCNTDSAFWKDSLNYIGTLNTYFQEESSDYDGILRQLIIKYSGKGKTIRHTISGISRYRFKFISLLSRFRILPKKQ